MFESDRIPALLSSAEKIALLAGIAAVTLSALSSLLARSAASFYKGFLDGINSALADLFEFPRRRHRIRILDPAQLKIREDPRKPWHVARERASARIQETQEAMRKQVSSARWSQVSNNSLTVGQYIVGGLLASSFVQASLSPKLVGSLGVIVLIASLIKQHFHPELGAQQATMKSVQLKALIRTSEDQLAILEAKIASGQDHTDAMISLLMRITERLTEIETSAAIEQRPEIPEKSNLGA